MVFCALKTRYVYLWLDAHWDKAVAIGVISFHGFSCNKGLVFFICSLYRLGVYIRSYAIKDQALANYIANVISALKSVPLKKLPS